ncbi:MAG TPA: response regulator transcription factor [Planctomycetota bacterium]|nr:response regulator transcription factor [Planctomycetota bacterium]
MAEPTRVLCVDDSMDIAELYRLLIDAEPDMRCVGVVTDPADVVATVARTGANQVLLDLTMPGPVTPLSVIRALAETSPDVRVVAFSGYDDEATQHAALDAGAWGFVSKHAGPSDVLDAIRQVATGNISLPGQRRP